MTEREEKKAARDRKEAERAQQRAALKKAIANEIKKPTQIVPVVATLATIRTQEGVKWIAKEAKYYCYELTREEYDNHPIYLTGSEFLNFLYVNGCIYIHHDGRTTPFLIGAKTAEDFLMMSPAHAVWHPESGLIWRYVGQGFNHGTELWKDAKFIPVPASMSDKSIAHDILTAIMKKYHIPAGRLAKTLGTDYATLLFLLNNERRASDRLLQRISEEFPECSADCQKLMKGKKVSVDKPETMQVMQDGVSPRNISIFKLNLTDDEGKHIGLLGAILGASKIPFCKFDIKQWTDEFENMIPDIKLKRLIHCIHTDHILSLGGDNDFFEEKGLNEEYVNLLANHMHDPQLQELMERGECKWSEVKVVMYKILLKNHEQAD